MGFLEAVIGFVEKMGESPADDQAMKHAAVRLADEEEKWVQSEVKKIVIEAYMIFNERIDGPEKEKKVNARLMQFGEDCFKRGAKAASRMNVIAE